MKLRIWMHVIICALGDNYVRAFDAFPDEVILTMVYNCIEPTSLQKTVLTLTSLAQTNRTLRRIVYDPYIMRHLAQIFGYTGYAKITRHRALGIAAAYKRYLPPHPSSLEKDVALYNDIIFTQIINGLSYQIYQTPYYRKIAHNAAQYGYIISLREALNHIDVHRDILRIKRIEHANFIATTLLEDAAKYNQIDIMKILIEHGVHVNHYGQTHPLVYVAHHGNIDAVRMLMRYTIPPAILKTARDYADGQSHMNVPGVNCDTGHHEAIRECIDKQLNYVLAKDAFYANLYLR